MTRSPFAQAREHARLLKPIPKAINANSFIHIHKTMEFPKPEWQNDRGEFPQWTRYARTHTSKVEATKIIVVCVNGKGALHEIEEIIPESNSKSEILKVLNKKEALSRINRILPKPDWEIVVLEDEPYRGQTIIKKLVSELPKTCFILVLFSPYGGRIGFQEPNKTQSFGRE